ncbi:MAG: hypothetical protein GX463_11510 [Methanothrix sp.]|nr:hypothetical protein [Methanothrix sp.]HPH48617.1 hypothetical protein [Methanothrix sp.]
MAKRLKDPEEVRKIRATIFDKLDRRGKWGPIHTSKENAVKGLPSHQLGAANEVLEAAIKEGVLILKPTSYGDQISLNFTRKEDIRAIIRELYL